LRSGMVRKGWKRCKKVQKGVERSCLAESELFMARLRRNNCAQVPRLVRWKNRLKLGEVLKVKVRRLWESFCVRSFLMVDSPFLRWSPRCSKQRREGISEVTLLEVVEVGGREEEPQILCPTGFVCSSCNGSVNRNMLAS